MKVLFLGDVIGKIGRRAVVQVIPQLRQELKPDVVIVNIENMAHGSGITKKTFAEIDEAEIDAYTSGNHVLKKSEAAELLDDESVPLIRPINFLEGTPGVGVREVVVGSNKILLTNIMGQVFMRDEYDPPFQAFDQLVEQYKLDDYAAVIVDFHAEATSEKVAFGHYVDGRASAVLGTHTHVPTADNKVLPGGTAYVTDVGMVGARDSVIGDTKDLIIEGFLAGRNPRIDVPEKGVVDVGAVLIDIDPKTRKATSITRVDKSVEV